MISYVCQKTFRNSELLIDDENLLIHGYSITRVDHPSNTKPGDICVYYKNWLSLKLLDIKYLQEYINLELIIDDKLCSFIILYQSLGQARDNFETFS